MAKVFTITEGLENLGAMKTGGQGSVYKGRRIGEIITAIKLLPTPIYSESLDDKNYIDFQNEVQKLKKVNEEPNPHVVTILSSGVTDSGNFPFIEMEYIEGPDLEELLKPPHDPIFTIKEVIKIAEQLANALSHCHRLNVKHGDVKSNNVKFNVHTGNYILLDFGLSVMSDEQRRSSLRHAGAIEYMAPEQNEGQMLFQTDVYSFGVILFQLLAGDVPFPLHDKGETARNNVRLSHMETPPPDVLEVRRTLLPETWPDEKKEREMHVPGWLLSMITKCLEKKPEDRFENGVELHEYIVLNSTLAVKNDEVSSEQVELLKEQTEKLQEEKDQLQKQLLQHHHQSELRDREIEELRAKLNVADVGEHQNTETLEPVYDEGESRRMVSRSSFMIVLILAIALGALAAYSFFRSKPADSEQLVGGVQDSTGLTLPTDSLTQQTTQPQKNKPAKIDTATKRAVKTTDKVKANNNTDSADNKVNDTEEEPVDTQNTGDESSVKYKVVSKAYFHDKPDDDSKRSAFINHWNNAVLTPVDERDGYVYVVFTNHLGQTSKGWLRKKDLVKAE